MIPHDKRYMIILEIWNAKNVNNITPNKSYNQYDTMKEVDEDVDMIIDMYHNVKPSSKHDPNSFFWGYVVLDFQEEKILSIGHDGLKYHDKNKIKDKSSFDYLNMLNEFFRKDDEIPKGYKWQIGEYAGWLQFRWGNKKNTIKYAKNGSKIEVNPANILKEPDFFVRY